MGHNNEKFSKDTFRYLLKAFGIDELINTKQRRLVAAYYESLNLGWKSQSRLNKIMPSNLKYGGHRNTCYDLRLK